MSRWIKLEETSPSGKTLFRCVICERVSPTPDKDCKVIGDPDRRCDEIEAHFPRRSEAVAEIAGLARQRAAEWKEVAQENAANDGGHKSWGLANAASMEFAVLADRLEFIAAQGGECERCGPAPLVECADCCGVLLPEHIAEGLIRVSPCPTCADSLPLRSEAAAEVARELVVEMESAPSGGVSQAQCRDWAERAGCLETIAEMGECERCPECGSRIHGSLSGAWTCEGAGCFAHGEGETRYTECSECLGILHTSRVGGVDRVEPCKSCADSHPAPPSGVWVGVEESTPNSVKSVRIMSSERQAADDCEIPFSTWGPFPVHGAPEPEGETCGSAIQKWRMDTPPVLTIESDDPQLHGRWVREIAEQQRTAGIFECGDCLGILHTSVVNGVYRIDPCKSCAEARADVQGDKDPPEWELEHREFTITPEDCPDCGKSLIGKPAMCPDHGTPEPRKLSGPNLPTKENR